MARKYGKKNVVKVDPLAYNIGLFGSGGIGKTSLAIEMCEKLVGENGYIHCNMLYEKGADAIQGAVSEDVKTWSKLDEIIDDIVENKDTDYKELRVLIYDTLDELENLGKKEVIRLHNLENPKNKTKNYNSCFGGYSRQNEKLSDIILDSIEKLRNVGVSVLIIGHVKRKTLTDPVTSLEYDVITAKCSNRIFDDIKTKLDVLGLGIIKREVGVDVMGKNAFTGKDITINDVKSEKRVISFRDDNYTVESKSRFADIINEVPFDADEFIKAIKDAIEKAYNKKDIGKTMEQAKKEQEKELKEMVKSNLEEVKKEKEIKNKFGNKEEILESIKTFYQNTENADAKTKIKESIHSLGLGKFDELLDCDYEAIINIYNITQE